MGTTIAESTRTTPSAFPEINHPNWAVVVTHGALGLRSLFEKFLSGVTSDTIKDAPIEKAVRPRLVDSYEAGETVLKLSNTTNVKPGDVLELRVPVAIPSEQSPKFSLVEELRSTNSLSTPTADDALGVLTNGSSRLTTDTPTPEPSNNPTTLPSNDQQQLELPWQKEVDVIAQKLAEIRSYKTYQIQVEAVLDDKQVQISPSWADIPKGVEITKRRPNLELPDTNFLHHVGLDWQVLVGEKLVSYSEYKKQVILQQRGMDLDDEGEILVGGVRLKDTLPTAAYDLFIAGLEVELAKVEIEVPHSDRVVRPDKAGLEMQARYGLKVRSLIGELSLFCYYRESIIRK